MVLKVTGKGQRGGGGEEEDEGFQAGEHPIQLPPGQTTWWQRQVRTKQGLTTNHCTKKLTPQEIARVQQVCAFLAEAEGSRDQ